jgi:hypothetical protein
MGMMAGGYYSVGNGGGGGAVTLSGDLTIFGLDTQIVGVRFNSDGTVDNRIATYTQISASTDWIIPNGDAPGLYDVMTNNWVDVGGSGGGFNAAAAAEGVWVALTSSREWNVQAVGAAGADSSAMEFDAHIRHNGSQIITSGSYRIESNGA